MPQTRITSTDLRDGTVVNADIASGAAIDASKIADGSVSNAEFQRLDGVTANIQTQFTGCVLTAPGVDLRNLIVPTGEFTALTLHDNWTSTVTPYHVFAVKNNSGSNALFSVSNVGGVYTVRVHIATPVRFYDSDSSNYGAIKAPTNITADYTLTLPTAAPVLNGYLTTDASGNLSWVVGTPASRTISTTAPLSGGGDLSANRTLTTSIATSRIVGRTTAGTGVMEELTVGTGLTLSAGSLALTSPVTIGNGGTGQTTAQNARNALLPTQTGNNGRLLQTDGTNVSWVVPPNAPASPSGSIQYNNSGVFGGSANLNASFSGGSPSLAVGDAATGVATVEAMPATGSSMIPVLMRQNQTGQDGLPFFRVDGTSAADTTKNISTATGWTEEEMIRINVNGVDRWIRAYSKTGGGIA